MFGTTKKETKIKVDPIGWLDPIEDKEQIIWCWNQTTKTLHKSVRTRFWLDTKEHLKEKLVRLQAFELLAYINSNITTEQEKKRIYHRERSKSLAIKEAAAFNKYREKENMMYVLRKMITPN